MRKMAVVAALAVCAVLGSQVGQASAHEKDLFCNSIVQTNSLTATEFITSPKIGCSHSRKIVKRYFHLVERTAETPGGCAQKRATVGCKVGAYECYSEYRPILKYIWGQCYGGKTSVSFKEEDFAQDFGPH